MYKLKNISGKIIGIDGKVAMPDEEVFLKDSLAEIPAVSAYVRLKMVEIEKIEEKKPEEDAPEEKPKRKRTTKKAAVEEPVEEA